MHSCLLKRSGASRPVIRRVDANATGRLAPFSYFFNWLLAAKGEWVAACKWLILMNSIDWDLPMRIFPLSRFAPVRFSAGSAYVVGMVRATALALWQVAVLTVSTQAAVCHCWQEDGADENDSQMLLVTVLDYDGQSIEKADVELTVRDSFGVRSDRYDTDNSGHAVVTVPADSDFISLTARKDGFSPRIRRWLTQRGQRVPDDITIELAPGIKIGGTVTNERGEPIRKAKVELMIRSMRYWFGDYATPSNFYYVEDKQSPVTDADGRWIFDGVPGDAVIALKLSHPDYCSDEDFIRSRPNLKQSQFRDFSAVSKMTDGVRISGKVIDSEGHPVPRAVVVSEPILNRFGNRLSVVADADGGFKLPTMKPGKFHITATASGWAPTMVEREVNSDSEPVEMTLNSGSPIRIRVIDGDEHPVCAGVAIGWKDSSSLYPRQIDGVADPIVPNRTDDQGIFDWPNAPHEPLRVWIRARGFKPQTIDATAGEDEVTVRLERDEPLIGHVVDASTGEPVDRFVVVPMTGSTVYRGMTIEGRHGAFALKSSFLLGQFQLLIASDGYRVFTSPNAIDKNSKADDLAFELEPAEPVSGTIVDRDGHPVSRRDFGSTDELGGADHRKSRSGIQSNAFGSEWPIQLPGPSEFVSLDRALRAGISPRDIRPQPSGLGRIETGCQRQDSGHCAGEFTSYARLPRPAVG